MPLTTSATRRLLRSQLVDLLVGPHGIDRYLELVRPEITVRDARARVVEVRHQTERSVTVTVRCNDAWTGFRAGQFVRVGVEIDGVRRTRTYSPASSAHREDGLLELTVTVHPHGLVSRHLKDALEPGAVLHLGPAQGDFTLPQPRPQRLLLISGGSGITPVLSMLRTLRDEGDGGEVAFVHYARTGQDWLYEREVRALCGAAEYVATRQGGARFDAPTARRLIGAVEEAHAAVCGPPALIEAVHEVWGAPDRVLSETFTPPSVSLATGRAATGILHFARSDRSVPVAAGTLLEQAEAAGLEPDFGCRMGICRTCTCRKLAGPIRNVRTGEVSEEEDEDVQLCVSVAAGDVALDL